MAKKKKTRIKQSEIVRLFGSRLRELRHSRGLTQAELARQAQITTTYIGRLENGSAAPGIDLVDRLAQALGTDVADLLPAKATPDTLAWDSTRKRPTTIHYDVFVRVDGENYIIPLDKEEPFDADNAVEYLNAGGWISPLFNP